MVTPGTENTEINTSERRRRTITQTDTTFRAHYGPAAGKRSGRSGNYQATTLTAQVNLHSRRTHWSHGPDLNLRRNTRSIYQQIMCMENCFAERGRRHITGTKYSGKKEDLNNRLDGSGRNCLRTTRAKASSVNNHGGPARAS